MSSENSNQMPEYEIVGRICQVVVEVADGCHGLINLSKAHDGSKDCFHVEWGDTWTGPEFQEVYPTLPLALLRMAAIAECVKNDAWFVQDFDEFVVIGTKFIGDVTGTLTNDTPREQAWNVSLPE